MGRIYHSVEELVGRTPLLKLTRLGQKLGLEAKILAKLEYFNPAGSVKDRVAKQMMQDAREEGCGPRRNRNCGTDFRQHRNRACFTWCRKWISRHSRNAGNDVAGAAQLNESLRGRIGFNSGRKGNEGCD